MRTVRSLFHVNFPTNKWDEMMHFYVDVCGFEVACRFSQADMCRMFGAEVKPEYEEQPFGAYIRVSQNAFIEIHEATHQGLNIEANPTSPFHHIAFLTDDIVRTAKNLAAKGYPLINSPLDRTPIDPENLKPMPDGCICTWMLDPDGHPIEVMQRPEDAVTSVFEKENPIENGRPAQQDKTREFCDFYHLSLHVRDIERTLDFYNRMGFETVFSLDMPDGSGRNWLTYVRVAQDQYLELFPIYEDHPILPRKEITFKDNDNFLHFSVCVTDIHKAALEWAEKGIQVVYAPFKNEPIPLEDDKELRRMYSPDGYYICWVQDPDGNWIEIMEALDCSLQENFEKANPF